MTRIAAAALLTLLAAGCGAAYSTTSITLGGNQVTRKEPVRIVPAGDTPSIVVDSPAGSVHLKAGEDKPLLVEAELQAPTEADLDRIKVSVTNEGGKVAVGWTAEGDRSMLSVHFTITAPMRSSLDVTTGAGSVVAGGFSRGLRAKSGGGSLETLCVGGDLDLETGAGSIKASGGRGAVRAKSGGGSISVYSEDGDLRLETRAGSVTVEGGSGKVDAKTGGGSMTVKDRTGSVALLTKAGSIEVTGGAGPIVASTGGGRVLLDGRALQGECSARTNAGGIDVVLAADASLQVDGRTTAGSIETDFPTLAVGRDLPRTVKGTLGDGKGGVLTLETGGGSLNLRRK